MSFKERVQAFWELKELHGSSVNGSAQHFIHGVIIDPGLVIVGRLWPNCLTAVAGRNVAERNAHMIAESHDFRQPKYDSDRGLILQPQILFGDGSLEAVTQCKSHVDYQLSLHYSLTF